MEAQEINEKLYKERADRCKTYPCRNIRASSLGHPCKRYLYLQITDWESQEAINPTTQAIFDLGNAIEAYAIQKIKDAGYEVITPSGNFKIETPLITGREDLRIKEEDGQLIPVEIKGLSAQEWERLNSLNDFLTSKQYYIRCYPSQLMAYLWKYEKPYGYFCLVNKQTGEIKFIKIDFDWEFVDRDFKKATSVYESIEKKEIPEGIDDPTVCEKCSMRNTCGHHIAIPTDVELDDELENLIDQKNSLKEQKKLYEDLDSQIKLKIGERPQVLAGKYLILRKPSITPAKHIEAHDEPEKISYRLTIKEITK